MLTLLKVLLSFASAVTQYLRDKGLMDAGEAKVIAEQLEGSLDALQRATKARADAVKRFDDSDGVPDEDDPNLRD